MVTWCSCIASSSAACTLAGARLISSARMIWAKSGPFLTWKSCDLLVEDHRADDVGRQQVGRELDAGERGVDDLRQRAHRERLGQPGHALEQDVAAGQQADEQALDHGVLADDPAGHFLEDALHGQRLGRLVGQLRRAHARWLLGVDGGKDSRDGLGHRRRADARSPSCILSAASGSRIDCPGSTSDERSLAPLGMTRSPADAGRPPDGRTRFHSPSGSIRIALYSAVSSLGVSGR